MGQSSPVPQPLPYGQNFGTTNFNTYPAGFGGWNGVSGGSTTTQTAAENSTPTGNATLMAAAPSTTAGLYGDGNGGDARAVVVTSSNATNGVNQFVLAVDTSGASNVTLSFDFVNVIAATRTVGCVVQYRVGNAGTWTTATGTGVPYVQSGGVVGAVTPAVVTLGNDADNQPEVQIRWAVWRGTEAGASSAFAIDNVTVLGGGQDPTGACCIGEVCTVTTQAGCSGAWSNGGVCEPNPCVPPAIGACCINGFCIGDLTESECLATEGATWGGDETSCGTFECPLPTGRCCLPDDTCVEAVSQNECANLGGSNWELDGFCDNFTCVPTAGPCCLDDQSCVIAEPADCDTQGGVFMGRGLACDAVSCVPASGANLVAKFDFDVNTAGVGNNLSFTINPSAPFTSPADGWGVYQRFYSANIPFALLDDTISIFEGDMAGIADETKLDKWFGLIDLQNNDNPAGTGTAEWAFNISGRSDLSISIDMAAMGDFEATSGMDNVPDEFDFSVSIDGGEPIVVFSIRADEAGVQMYTLAGGTMVSVDDPLRVNGDLYLNNTFQTFTADIPGTGNFLTLSFTASNNSDEAFAFDNIMIMGDNGGGPQFCDADWCQDGSVGVPDIFCFLSDWFAQDPEARNYGGTEGVPAIFAFLSEWFGTGQGPCTP